MRGPFPTQPAIFEVEVLLRSLHFRPCRFAGGSGSEPRRLLYDEEAKLYEDRQRLQVAKDGSQVA